MSEMKLVILDRDHTGSGGARRTRKEGFIPGVMYGKDILVQPIKVNASELRRIVSKKGIAAIFNAVYKDMDRLVLLKEVQTEPMTGEILHIDIQQIDENQKITATVPLVAVGVEKIPAGGILQQLINEVEISCLPKDVPKAIEFDVAGMTPGQQLHISDLNVADGIEILDDPNEAIAIITEARVTEEVVGEEGEEAEGA